MINYYDILAVSRKATLSEIKASFKKFALKYHPDKNQGNKVSEELFKSINEAYQTLSNQTKRSAYDQKLEYFLFSKSSRTYKSEEKPQSNNEYYNEDKKINNDFYSKQGKYYAETPYKPKERNIEYYAIGLTLFLIIATVFLLFGMMMNNFSAKEKYKAALYNYNNENYFKALREVDEALEFNPSYVEGFELRGDIKMELKKYKGALLDYNLAIEHSKVANQILVRKKERGMKLLQLQMATKE